MQQNLYFPLIDSDNEFLNTFYVKQICKIILIHGHGFYTR